MKRRNILPRRKKKERKEQRNSNLSPKLVIFSRVVVETLFIQIQLAGITLLCKCALVVRPLY